MPRGGSRHLSPDAVTNVVHGYAHINDKKDTEEVLPVKSSSTKKKSDTKEKEDDWEDPFFHAVLHNNDRSSDSTVKNVSKKDSDDRVDEEMFVKFSKRVFHYPRNGEKKKVEEDEEKHEPYGLREFIQDSSMME